MLSSPAAEASWIWLKDLDQVILPDKAIDPVNEYDTRKSVPELLTQHATKIALVQEQLQKEEVLYEPSKHDDLFILRFLLSHKQKVKRATKAAKHALAFRKRYRLDEKDLRHEIPHRIQQKNSADTNGEGSNGRYPFAGTECLAKSWRLRGPDDAFVFTIPDDERGVVAFLKYSGIKYDKATMKALSQEDLASLFIFVSEWTFQWLDYVTRKTGRLTKSVRFLNMQGASFFSGSMEAIRRDGKVMEEMEDVYPQLLQAVFACNCPHWIHTLWAMIRPVMPKRVVEKVDIIDPKSNQKERDRLLNFVSMKDLPQSLGGDNEKEAFLW